MILIFRDLLKTKLRRLSHWEMIYMLDRDNQIAIFVVRSSKKTKA